MNFPVMGSIVLFSLFLCFKLLPKELINNVLAAYFVVLGMLSLTATLEPLVAPSLPAALSTQSVELKLRPVAWLPGLKVGAGGWVGGWLAGWPACWVSKWLLVGGYRGAGA